MKSVHPASQLSGRDLGNGWTVSKRVERAEGATGGNFSVGYLVEHSGGQRGFLKALDYSSAFAEGVNTPAILQFMTEAFNFEKAVLERCRAKRMRRVATAIAEGSIVIPEAGPYGKVDYLIFELADADIRTHLDRSAVFDVAWRLRALHHATIGLRQLHSEHIAHQDLKPSNLLVFAEEGTKIADLGQAARRSHESPYDDFPIAGDTGYSSPELLYGHGAADFGERRLAPDLYMLGSLAYFMFTGMNLTSTMLAELHPTHHPQRWADEYADVLPYVREAFARALTYFDDECRLLMSPIRANELSTIVRELADPDYKRRGDPKSKTGRGNSFSLERYVTRFNVLAARMEMRLSEDEPTA